MSEPVIQPAAPTSLAEGSSADVNSTLTTAATVGVQGAGVGLMVNALDKEFKQSSAEIGHSADAEGSQAAAEAPRAEDSQSAAHVPVVTAPEAKTPLFKQWRALQENLHKALTLAAPHLPEADRAAWEASVNGQLAFVQSADKFERPEVITQAFLAEPGKSAEEVATSRFETIALALSRLTTPAAATKFFEKVKTDSRWANYEDRKEFTSAQWSQDILLNKTGQDLDMTVKDALQHADANIALDTVPNSAAVKAGVQALTTAVHTALAKVKELTGASDLYALASTAEADGKTPEQRELEHLSAKIITGLKLTEATPLATAEQLTTAAGFISQLQGPELSQFIRACHEKDAHDGYHWNEESRLDEPHQFASLLSLANADAWKTHQETAAKEQAERAQQFLAATDRAGIAIKTMLQHAPETATIFSHGVTLEEFPQKLHARFEQYLKTPNAAGVVPVIEKDSLTALNTLVADLEATATKTPAEQQQWVEKHGLAFVSNATELAEKLQRGLSESSPQLMEQSANYFENRLSEWVRKHSENNGYDSGIQENGYARFGATNEERLKKLHFLEHLKPHEAHAVLDAIGIQPKGRELSDAAILVTDRAARLSELATPHGLASLHVQEPHDKPHPKPEHGKPHVDPSLLVHHDGNGGAQASHEQAAEAVNLSHASPQVDTAAVLAHHSENGGAQVSTDVAGNSFGITPKAAITPNSIKPDAVKETVGQGAGMVR